MPNLNAHLRTGVIAHSFLILSALIATVTLNQENQILVLAYSGITLPITLVGAIIPDIDHPDSHVYQRVRCHLPQVIGGVTATIFYLNAETFISVIKEIPIRAPSGFLAGMIATLAMIGMVRWTRRLIPHLRPPHRGATHRSPIGGALAINIGGLFVAVGVAISLPHPLLMGTAAACAFGIGFLSHLYCDGLIFDPDTHLRIENNHQT